MNFKLTMFLFVSALACAHPSYAVEVIASTEGSDDGKASNGGGSGGGGGQVVEVSTSKISYDNLNFSISSFNTKTISDIKPINDTSGQGSIKMPTVKNKFNLIACYDQKKDIAGCRSECNSTFSDPTSQESMNFCNGQWRALKAARPEVWKPTPATNSAAPINAPVKRHCLDQMRAGTVSANNECLNKPL